MIKKSTTDTLIDNLNHLKKIGGDSVYDIAKRSGMKPRTVSNILARQQGKVSIEQADLLASAYGLEGWHLLLPNLPQDLVDYPHLGKLLKNYFKATNDGRNLIDMIAEREAAYHLTGNDK